MSGPFGSSQWMYASGGFYGHPINQSLRFSAVDGGFAEITYGSAGNRRTWSWSAWIKRSGITKSNRQRIWATQDGSGIEENIRFETDDQIRWISHNSDGSDNDHDVTTSAVFRDTSAWFHLLIVKDTTEGTDSNRVKIYINGSLQSFEGSPDYPSSNFEGHINKGQNHHIGSHVNDNSETFDGYMAEVHFIDGTAVSPSVLGETKAGIWIPKKYTGSHGTNGYHFTFADTSSNNALFNDDSANSNNFSATGIVAGHDFMKDTPTNNFCTLSSINKTDANVVLANSNLDADFDQSGGWNSALATFALDMTAGGKFYWEAKANEISAVDKTMIGMIPYSIDFVTNTNKSIVDNTDYGDNPKYGLTAHGAGVGGYTYAENDVINVAVDIDNAKVYYGKNGTYFGDMNPSAGTGSTTQTLNTSAGRTAYVPFVGGYGGSEWQGNFGQDGTLAGTVSAGGNADANGHGNFLYTVPTNFLALCTANLPNPAIDPAQGESPADFFNPVIFTGNGTNQDIDVGFQPDFAFVRQRTDASGGYIVDSVRGDSAADLQPANANAEGDFANITFGSNGYNVSGNNNLNNENAHNYVSWNLLAGGSASTLTDGSINTSASVGAKNGFSILTFTGNQTNGATIAHGLSTRPELVIFKNRSTGSRNWQTNYIDGTARRTVYLNLNSAEATPGSQQTLPTSTLITLDAGTDSNENSDNILAYCFANVEGHQRVGIYTGNGNADGPLIYTGFRPAFILGKGLASGREWWIVDNKRNPVNIGTLSEIHPGTTAAEQTETQLDIVSNGFKIRDDLSLGSDVNADGEEYLYLAIAEQPFKFANAR